MALSDSALSELLDALRVGDSTDLVRELAQILLQELIETEASAVIGAARYERNVDRVVERNGHRSKVLSTKAGDLTLGIPNSPRAEPHQGTRHAIPTTSRDSYVLNWGQRHHSCCVLEQERSQQLCGEVSGFVRIRTSVV
jgi:hypothetical protein